MSSQEANNPKPSAVTPEHIAWTTEVLERLYDVPFLRRYTLTAPAAGRFADARAAQEALLQAIQQLRPPASVPVNAPAWRIYNVLHLRYEQGLTQSEVAAKLAISLRHLQREQLRASEAVAVLLFDEPPLAPLEHKYGALVQAPTPGTADPDVTRMDDLLRSALALLDPLLQKQNLQIEVTLHPPLPSIQADAMIVRQLVVGALSWLISGVVDSTLSVIVDAEPAGLVLRLSKPLMTSSSQEIPGKMNAGLAEHLDTLRQLAQAVHAQFQLVDEPAEAAHMTLHLPVLAAKCVLMVDDNTDEIQLVRHYLEQAGEFYLIAVTRAEDAIRQTVEQKPDCILLDVMMPGRDGWELLARLKAFPETAGIPVVISSILRERELARALGAAEVLVKPFDAAQLVAVLRSAIGPSSHLAT